jgi:hypothetical protein
MGLCCSDPMTDDYVRRQEQYVNREMHKMGDGWKTYRMAGDGPRYNSSQIRGKLRREFAGGSRARDNAYVSQSTWRKMRGYE